MAVLIVLAIVAVVVIGLVVWGFSGYNGLIRSRNLVQEAWRQVDVELKRRRDLVPNLVETVKGYAGHEAGTLEAVMKARAQAARGGDTPEELAENEGELSRALGRLLSITEAYPDLKANENFLALQRELSATEDRIASGRRYYNATVRDLNTKVESVPTNVLARMGGVTKAEYFEADPVDREAPQVSFGGAGATGGLQGGAPQVGGQAGPGQLAGGYDAGEGLGQGYTPSPIQDRRPGDEAR